MSNKKKVLVAMSGGVDSSITAALLLEQGYECIGAHMKLWKDPAAAPHPDTAKDVKKICQTLGIPFVLVDLTDTFKKDIVDHFVTQYRTGETPNPCIHCNRIIKFGALLQKAKELNCDYLATGHYVKLIKAQDGQIHMYSGSDPAKDQSYFLYTLTQDQLKHILFPLGDYKKTQVRKLAKKYNLPELEEKAESQDVCFYPEKTNKPFLKRHLKENVDYKPGPIKNCSGKIIGQHSGLPFYTLGQRRGLDIGGGPALYVCEIDHAKNTLIASPTPPSKAEVHLKNCNFISGKFPSSSETLKARIRHQGSLIKVKIHSGEPPDTAVVTFTDPPNAPMAGQSLVLYNGDELIGGGIMTN